MLSIVLDMLSRNDIQPEVVFGSEFQDDFDYTQVNTQLESILCLIRCSILNINIVVAVSGDTS